MGQPGRILITGGAGFLGSILTRTLLGEGRDVRVLDNLTWGPDPVRAFLSHPNYQFMRGDIRNSQDIEEALDGIDAVIHLAALVGDPLCAAKPEEARAVNQDATRNLIDACRRKGIDRFIFASTCSNYGISDVSVPADEERELNPVSLYAETKIAAEQYLLDTSSGSFCPVLLRFGTAYGISSRPRADLLINSLVKDAIDDGLIVIFGPESWRPYSHANDLARAMILAMDAPEDKVKNETFNVVVENFTKRDLAERISARMNVPVEYSTSKDDPRNYRVSGQKFIDRLGFEGSRAVDEALDEIIAAGEIGIL